MASDIVLTAALRNNLLSLQNTQRLIDETQLRLATGLRVNSALDNATSFFTAQSLNNRAGDLTRLLDSINLSIRTIEEADAGVTALTSLIEQADSIVGSARDELAASEGVSRVVGDVDLSTTADITTLAGIDDNDTFTITTTDDAGTQITGAIVINTGDTADSLAQQITDVFADTQNGEVTASVTAAGFLSIQSSDGRTFRVTDSQVGSGTELTDAGFTALGLGDFFEVETFNNGGAQTRAASTVVAGNTLQSISIFENSGDLAEAGDTLAGATFTDADGTTIVSGFAVGDSIAFTVYRDSGNVTETYTLAATSTNSFQDVVDEVNQSTTTIDDFIQANFDSSTGTFSITVLDDSVNAVGITATTAAAGNFNIGLGDPSGNLDTVALAAGVAEERIYTFNSSNEALDSFAADFNVIRAQIDDIVEDANFRGINLLNGDDLVTFFNENSSNSLTTSGVTFTSAGLGVTEATFRDSTGIELSATQVRGALTSVRNFGSAISNSLAIIQTRRDFTESTINTLTAGADDLTVADQNEEGANLLALQTRQALGTTSLSLASQSQQSVLRLF